MNDPGLVVWLKRQLDEDERAIARIAAASCHGVESTAEKDYFRFVDRAPAELDAARRILGRHQPIEIFGVMLCTHCGVAGGQRARAVAAWPCPELRDLVAPYSDRPGYRPEWAPL